MSARAGTRQNIDERSQDQRKQGYAALDTEETGDLSSPAASDKLLVEPRQDSKQNFMEELRQQMGITTNQTVLPSGEIEEHWEFEADTYTVGILGVMREGLPAAAPKLAIAVATPVIQTLILFTILGHLMTDPYKSGGDSDGTDHTVSSFICAICFLLMGLNLSNEAMEAMWKLTFAMRAFGGVYKGLKGPAWIAVLLAFIQFGMSIYTVGCSTLVINEQPSAIDAFMNFVALAFLTEVDNLLMSSRSVSGLVEHASSDIKVLVDQGSGVDQKRPWSVDMAICVNLLTVGAACLQGYTYSLNPDGPMDSGENHLLSPWQVPSAVCALLLLNAAMCLGSRTMGTFAAGGMLAMVCIVTCFVDKGYLYHTGTRLLPVTTPGVPFWFALLAVASANSELMDPFPFLRCPIQTPSLVWMMLLLAVAEILTWRTYGT